MSDREANPARGDPAPKQTKTTGSGKAPKGGSDVPSSSAGKSAKEPASGTSASADAGAQAKEDSNMSHGEGGSKSSGKLNRRQRRRLREQKEASNQQEAPDFVGTTPAESEWQTVGKKQSKRSAPRSESQAPPKKTSAPTDKPNAAKGNSKANESKGKSANKPSSSKTGAKGSQSSSKGFKIPKRKTYADTARGSTPQEAEELGDLSKEEEDSLVEPGDKGGIPLYVHTSKEKRMPISAKQFDFVLEALQKRILEEMLATGQANYFITKWKHIKDRGLIICTDDATIKYIMRQLEGLSSTDPDTGEVTFYRGWEKGTFGTTLVSVIVGDKGTTPYEELKRFLTVFNGLKGPLWNLRTGKVQAQGMRKVTFGVEAQDAAHLRTLKAEKGMLRLGLLLCRFHIGKEDKPEEAAKSGTNPSSGASQNKSHDESREPGPSGEAMELDEVAEDPQAKAKAAEAQKAEAAAKAKAMEEEAAKVMANI